MLGRRVVCRLRAAVRSGLPGRGRTPNPAASTPSSARPTPSARRGPSGNPTPRGRLRLCGFGLRGPNPARRRSRSGLGAARIRGSGCGPCPRAACGGPRVSGSCPRVSGSCPRAGVVDASRAAGRGGRVGGFARHGQCAFENPRTARRRDRHSGALSRRCPAQKARRAPLRTGRDGAGCPGGPAPSAATRRRCRGCGGCGSCGGGRPSQESACFRRRGRTYGRARPGRRRRHRGALGRGGCACCPVGPIPEHGGRPAGCGGCRGQMVVDGRHALARVQHAQVGTGDGTRADGPGLDRRVVAALQPDIPRAVRASSSGGGVAARAS